MHRQLKLGARITNMEGLDLSKKVINQPKIWCAISMFTSFRSAATDKIVPAPWLICTIYLEPIWQEGIYAKLGDRSRWCLSLRPGWLHIPRLWYIILLIYRPSCWRWQKNWWTGTSEMRYWGFIPYIDTSLPPNQVKLLKLHCLMWSHTHRECSRTSLSGKTNSNHTLQVAWSGTWTDPRPIKALVLRCIEMAQNRGITSAVGSKPEYSSLKYDFWPV
jgi:hypothetical protein